MFILECLYEHVPVFLKLVRQRNSGLLDQLTAIDHDYHSEVHWDVPEDLPKGVQGFQGIDMHDILVNLKYARGVYSLRVRLIGDPNYVDYYAKFLDKNLKIIAFGGNNAKHLPPFNWKKQQELHRIKLLLDITG